ncbi:hypothetical protein L596_006872 [Steinernema carpocapsae]|uniref:Uncharacterized protein n=1 Tax=Steinernema carpocapsae TaxID=34508 RepID=A0A4U5P766_STECR|nr:hypothetical protein L596_006872 [Steinernema carpocapsae]
MTKEVGGDDSAHKWRTNDLQKATIDGRKKKRGDGRNGKADCRPLSFIGEDFMGRKEDKYCCRSASCETGFRHRRTVVG